MKKSSKIELEVATLKLSGHRFNASRKQAYDTIKKLIDGEEVEEWELADVMKKFLPPNPKKGLIGWLNSSLSKDEERHVLNYVYIDEDSVVSTDGRTIKLIANDGSYNEGWHHIINGALKKVNVPEDQNFPNYRQVIPSTSTHTKVESFDVIGRKMREGDSSLTVRFSYGKDEKHDMLFNEVFFNNAFLDGNREGWDVYIDPSKGRWNEAPMMAKKDNLTCVVMPLLMR